METKAHTPQYLRKRKFLLVLPLLVLPFLTLLFWALGGGKANDIQAQSMAKGGLNVELPDANLKDDKSLDKLSYYEKAASDSAKLDELMKTDPYYKQHKAIEKDMEMMGPHPGTDTLLPSTQNNHNALGGRNSLNASAYNSQDYADPNEAKVYKKLNELNRAMNQATIPSDKTTHYSDVALGNNTATVNTADIDRLEQIMERTKNSDNEEDPEMQQLNSMMDKIIDIQHPERVKEKIEQTPAANKGQVFAVAANGNDDNTSLLQNNKGADTSPNNDVPTNGFFSLDDDLKNTSDPANAMAAVIHETQTVVDGAMVKLRLLTDIAVAGTLIPKGSFVFGVASLNGERLHLTINSIRYKNSLFSVQLSVVDMDGIEGIYIPGAITRQVAKQSAERAVQGIGLTTLDPSLGAQAASAGMEAVKSLLGRKAKQVKVTLKAGYQVLLQDKKQKSSS